MKTLLTIIFCLVVLAISTNAFAETKTVRATWEQPQVPPGNVVQIAGAKIFKNGIPVFTVNDPALRSAEFPVEFTSLDLNGDVVAAEFTMVNFDGSGRESEFSTPKVLTISISDFPLLPSPSGLTVEVSSN